MTVEHALCTGPGDCVVAAKLKPKDFQYHNSKGNEHCAVCGVFWKFREKHECGPRKPKAEAPKLAKPPGWKAAVAAWFGMGFEFGRSGRFKTSQEAWAFYVSKKKKAEG